MNFKTAFAAARKAGKKEFTWNGKSYNTKIKEEVAPPKRPSSPRPKARPDGKPSVISEAPKQPKAPAPVAPIKGVVRDAGKDRVVKAATAALDRVQAPKVAPKPTKPVKLSRSPTNNPISRAAASAGRFLGEMINGKPKRKPVKLDPKANKHPYD